MVSKKKIVVAVITAIALSAGVAGTASAHGKGMKTTEERTAQKAERAAFEALVAKTIGVDAAVIKTRLAAGETLGAIAGTKKDALIAVLVTEHSKRIDAAVTAGKLTAAQATVMKAGLAAHVTSQVDSVRGPKDGQKGGPGMGGHKGGQKHGGPGMGGLKGQHGGKGDRGPKGGLTPPPTPGTATSSTTSSNA